jgi:hypothetical protein
MFLYTDLDSKPKCPDRVSLQVMTRTGLEPRPRLAQVRVVNFATSKNLVVKSTMFPNRSIHKYTWTSLDGKTQPDRSHFDR